jgi:hypothetical protein
MRIEDIELVGLSTKEIVSLGPGARDWSPISFRGPVLLGSQLGNPGDRRLYMLPPHLLKKLYERFLAQNPLGTCLADPNEIEHILFDVQMSLDERTELYDSGQIGWDIFNPRGPNLGRDRYLPYLPALADPRELQAVLLDEKLNLEIRPLTAPTAFEDGWSGATRHFRWADWRNNRDPGSGS